MARQISEAAARAALAHMNAQQIRNMDHGRDPGGEHGVFRGWSAGNLEALAHQQLQGGAPPVAHPSQQLNLQGIINALSGNLSQAQMMRMQQGYTGANGAVGGMHGALQGLSPYAVHYLATSGLLTKDPTQQISMTDASGNPLTGAALWAAQQQQAEANKAPVQYSAMQGLTAQQLGSVLGGFHQAYGFSPYAKGYTYTPAAAGSTGTAGH